MDKNTLPPLDNPAINTRINEGRRQGSYTHTHILWGRNFLKTHRIKRQKSVQSSVSAIKIKKRLCWLFVHSRNKNQAFDVGDESINTL